MNTKLLNFSLFKKPTLFLLLIRMLYTTEPVVITILLGRRRQRFHYCYKRRFVEEGALALKLSTVVGTLMVAKPDSRNS
jgi:hypothetical protein